MPTITQTDLEARFDTDELVQVTNPTNPAATTIAAQRVTDAIADVDALITAKLAARYAVPLASTPLLLRNLACDLVRARLYEDRITDHVASRERAAMKLLDEIASGALQLGLDAAAQQAAPSSGPQFTTTTRVFSPSTLADYAP